MVGFLRRGDGGVGRNVGGEAMNMEEWLKEATSKIEYDPDREAVCRELEDHLQDRQERYAARGLSPEEAEAAAVADMGNAADIAEELGKLHRPFWGYLWTFSKLLLGLAFIVCFIRVCGGMGGYWPVTLNETHLYEGYYDFTVVSQQRLPGRVTVGNYTVSASAVLLESEERGEQRLCLSLRFFPHIPWEPVDLRELHNGIIIRGLTDSSGRQYVSTLKYLKSKWLGDVGTAQDIIFGYLEFCIRPEDGGFPEWMDVPLGMSNYILRVDLGEGVSLP